MKTYILRIYRYKKGKPRSLVGLVEEVGEKGRKAFTNYDELWDILNSLKGLKKQASINPLPRRKRVGGKGEKFFGQKAVNKERR